ncbi:MULTISPECIES: hypothetical protein [Haloarcula]|uniref:hypothetical protein n=1 Tax=Haloarcula TaxID=2237 RepID=UPI0023EDCFA8|nr:hypothetical protein [Halomicroarcula sp. XH51]
MTSTEPTRKIKSTLFCPSCEYRGEADTDWVEYTLRGHTQRRCPACYDVVDRRPARGDEDAWARYTAPMQSGLVAWKAGLQRVSESVRQFSPL